MNSANNILFRASGVYQLMVNPKTKADLFSESAIDCMLDAFLLTKGRKDEVSNKYIEKGHEREEDAITLYSRLTKTNFKKNSIRLSNDFTTGEIDLFEGESIAKAD